MQEARLVCKDPPEYAKQWSRASNNTTDLQEEPLYI